jgi:hypothetical protein
MSKQRKIIVSPNTGFAGTVVAFTASFEDYDLGDPVGVGATEEEAREDLLMELELNDQ